MNNLDVKLDFAFVNLQWLDIVRFFFKDGINTRKEAPKTANMVSHKHGVGFHRVRVRTCVGEITMIRFTDNNGKSIVLGFSETLVHAKYGEMTIAICTGENPRDADHWELQGAIWKRQTSQTQEAAAEMRRRVANLWVLSESTVDHLRQSTGL